MVAMLEAKGISKQYGSGEMAVQALEQVELTLQEGEFAVIMGASGSGKSTLLHILGGLERPDLGARLWIGGEEVHNFYLEPHATRYRQTKLGFVFQSYNLLSSLTAEENVGLPMLLAGAPKREVRERAQEMLQMVGLFERRGHVPSQMSGGQQQRVAIARALVHRPPILLADEPTGNLDSKTTADMMELFLEMREKLKQTILLVTHDPIVSTYADRVVFVQDGRIAEEQRNQEDLPRHERAFRVMEKLRRVMEVAE